MDFFIALLMDPFTKIKILGWGIYGVSAGNKRRFKANAEKSNKYILQLASDLMSSTGAKDNTILDLQTELEQLKKELMALRDRSGSISFIKL